MLTRQLMPTILASLSRSRNLKTVKCKLDGVEGLTWSQVKAIVLLSSSDIDD